MSLEVLTNTKRRDWQNCPRYFMHKHLQHLSPRIQRTGRRRGSIFGAAVDAYSRWMGETSDPTDPDLVSEDFRRVFIRKFVEGQYDELRETGNLDSEAVAALDVEEIKVWTMADLYVGKYGHDVRREMEFSLPLVNPRTNRSSRAFSLGGKIDGVARTWTRPDGVNVAVIIEDKFVQQIQKAMIMRLPLDAQANEYVDAFLHKGWDAMVMYRHTKYPGINPTKEKIPPALTPSGRPSTAKYVPAESLEAFEQRIREEVAEKPEMYFDQQELYFPKEHMDDYRSGRWGIAQQIIAARKVFRDKTYLVEGTDVPPALAQAFPMNSSRCWEYGGCEFIPLCTRQEGAYDLYVVQEDNPELTHGKEVEGVTSEYAGVG